MTSINIRLASLTLTALVASALVAGAGGPAQARSDGGATGAGGSCSRSAEWTLKAESDDGRIEVEAEVDSNHKGQVWRWRIKHNGSVSAKGQATTHGRSGSFSVERTMVNLSGTDRFALRAVNDKTGEVCKGRVSF